jgi:cytochrome c553
MMGKPAAAFVTFALALWLAMAASLPAAPLALDEFTAALRAAGDLDRGEKLFLDCVACHASDGRGAESGDAPGIAGQYRGVLLRQLVDFRHGRRWDVRMERVADPHRLPKVQDLADVATFVSALPWQPTADHGDSEQVLHGGTVYAELCASCHGPSAAGSDARRIPRLAGQSYQYVLREMYYTVDNRRPNLAGLHVTLFKRFARDEFVGVADYLSRLSP